jgi:hypothetical protein
MILVVKWLELRNSQSQFVDASLKRKGIAFEDEQRFVAIDIVIITYNTLTTDQKHFCPK